MGYALIPDGYKLRKVNKAQKDAISSKRRHDDFKALLNNPNTPIVVGGAIGAVLAVKLGEEIIKDLEKVLGDLGDDAKEVVTGTVAKVTNPVKIGVALGQGVFQTSLDVLPTRKEIEDILKLGLLK